MKKILTATAAMMALAMPALAEGDATAGEEAYNKGGSCKTCHMLQTADGETIIKGGRVGPNLYGVIGRTAGSYDGFKYGKGLAEAQEDGFVWTAEELAVYIVDPRAWLEDKGYNKQSKMTYKHRGNAEDVAAFLATFSEAEEESGS